MTTRVRPRILRLGPAELDLDGGRVRHPEREIALTPLETSVLTYLAARPRREVSRAELLANVWAYASGARTRTVDALICRLRDKLGEPRGQPRHLLTVSGGYRLLASPPEGCEALCAELVAALSDGAIVTLAGPGPSGKTELARFLAYQLEGFWVEVDAPEPGGVARALGIEGIERPEGLDPGALWVLDGAGPLDEREQRLLLAMARCGALLVTSLGPLGLPGERVVQIPPLAPSRWRRVAEAPPPPGASVGDEQRAVLEAAAVFRGAFLPSGLCAVADRDVEPLIELLLSQGLLVRHGAEHLALPAPVRALLVDRPPDAAAVERHRKLLVRRAREDFWDPYRLRPEYDDLKAAFDASLRCWARDDLVDLLRSMQRVAGLSWDHPAQHWIGERVVEDIDHPMLWVSASYREHYRSHPAEAWRLAERAAALAATPAEQAEVDLLFGTLELWRDRAESACLLIERACEAFAALGDRCFEAAALSVLAVARSDLDDIPGADRAMAEARACVPDPPAYLRCHLDLLGANLDRKAGREQQAAGILERLVASASALDDTGSVLRAQIVLMDVLLCLGDLERASRVIQEATNRASRSGSVRISMCLMCNLAELHLGMGQPQLAVLAARDACVLSRHLHHKGVRLGCAGLLGLALLVAGELPEALEVLETTVAQAAGDDGARHAATLAVARARASDATALELLRAAEQAAVIPSTCRWVAWCEQVVRPHGTALDPRPGVYEAIGKMLLDSAGGQRPPEITRRRAGGRPDR